jgi:hypothetical protein
MTKQQVEAIFGVPDGSYDWAEPDGLSSLAMLFDVDKDGFPDVFVYHGGGATNLTPYLGWPHRSNRTWTSQHGSFTVWFDINEHVVGIDAATEVRIVPPWQRWWRVWKQP